MSQSVKRDNSCRYYTIGRRNSSKTYASIFKVAIEYQNVAQAFPLPAHL